VRLLMVLVLLAGAASSRTAKRPPPPAEVQQVLTRVLAHAESTSLYRNRVPWAATRARIHTLADTASSIAALVPALRHLFASMGDEHARLYLSGRVLAYYYGEPKPRLRGFNRDLQQQIQTASVFPFRAVLAAPGVGYVRIVGLPMGDNAAMAKRIEDAVCALHREGATRWIVDLRYNGGGNLNPMAEGIAAILGDGVVGGRAGLTPQEQGEWRVTQGDFVNEGYSIELPNGCTMPEHVPVAVLIGVHTASSGEALAVMFKGRPNTRFFGGKTLGLITVTDWTVINDSTAMTISVGYYRDRTGRVYDEFVDVDEPVPFVPTETLGSDLGVQRALAWLGAR
jgi:carboxyl-terminal processing protease